MNTCVTNICMLSGTVTSKLSTLIQLLTSLLVLNMILNTHKTTRSISSSIILSCFVEDSLSGMTVDKFLIWWSNLTYTNYLIAPLASSVSHVVIKRILWANISWVVCVDKMVSLPLSRNSHVIGSSSKSLLWDTNDIFINTLLSGLFAFIFVEIYLCRSTSACKRGYLVFWWYLSRTIVLLLWLESSIWEFLPYILAVGSTWIPITSWLKNISLLVHIA